MSLLSMKAAKARRVAAGRDAVADAAGGVLPMMPCPEEVAGCVDRAERVAEGGRLSRLEPLERRRMRAWAVFEQLRRQRQDEPELVPVSA